MSSLEGRCSPEDALRGMISVSAMDRVVQRYDGSLSVELEKELITVRTGGDAQSVGVVRKRLPDRPTRGALVLIHGLGQNRYTWHIEGRSLSAFLVREGWDVSIMDLRGHGRSWSERPHRLADHIEVDLPAVMEEVAVRSGHERVFLVGHSMGGIVAYGAAGLVPPERVGGLVTLGTPYRFGWGSISLRLLGALLERGAPSWVDDPSPRSIRRIGRWLRKRRGLMDSRLVPVPIRAWAPGSMDAHILERYLSRAFDTTSVRALRELALFGVRSGGGFGRDYGAAFESLDRPLFVIAGTCDRLAPPASVRPAYERSRSRDRRYEEVPLGHIDIIVGRHAPTLVWPHISRWLEAHGDAGASQGRAQSLS